MIIDEQKVIKKSKSYSKGYKGMMPSFDRSSQKNNKMRDIQIAINVAIVLSFLAGLIALIYTLVSEGATAVERITDQSEQPTQYLEVTFKPKK
ncbi:MAG: hypothetical protein IJF70_03375 [Opitutales bacterium]|nr:hypothetical protein [Opitutales bacterium]